MSHNLTGRVRTLERRFREEAIGLEPVLPLVFVSIDTYEQAELCRKYQGAVVSVPADLEPMGPGLPPRITFEQFMALASSPDADPCFLPEDERDGLAE